jgi:hypothetical protein
VVGCVGLVRDVTAIPSRWTSGNRVFLLRGEGAELVRFVWQNASRWTLAHDISGGGIEVALREAADWSGLPGPESGPHGPGVLVACAEAPAWPDLQELGVAG